jgi:hypothetical protein
MNHPLLTKKIYRKESSDELSKAGDYCIVENLGSIQGGKPHPAIVLKCPFCRLDMASTKGHTIKIKRGWIRRICGLPEVLTVSPMLQCPYVPTHRFKIVNRKVIPL